MIIYNIKQLTPSTRINTSGVGGNLLDYCSANWNFDQFVSLSEMSCICIYIFAPVFEFGQVDPTLMLQWIWIRFQKSHTLPPSPLLPYCGSLRAGANNCIFETVFISYKVYVHICIYVSYRLQYFKLEWDNNSIKS